MQSKININIAVDVVKALSNKSLEGSIYMMDDSIFNSNSQGTKFLNTRCAPGQIINWVVYAVDLQTPVSIKDISFEVARENNYEANKHFTNENPDFKTWEGIAPNMMLGQKYFYRLSLQMGNGKDSILSINTASISLY